LEFYDSNSNLIAAGFLADDDEDDAAADFEALPLYHHP
jgi:hypothetical protein